MIDLYTDDFDSRLTGAERRSYFTTPYVAKSCPEVGPELRPKVGDGMKG